MVTRSAGKEFLLCLFRTVYVYVYIVCDKIYTLYKSCPTYHNSLVGRSNDTCLHDLLAKEYIIVNGINLGMTQLVS